MEERRERVIRLSSDSTRYIFRSRHTGKIKISVGMLEVSHMLRELNKWTLIVYYKL